MISSQSVQQICKSNGIANVAIIDDVFDPPSIGLSAAERQQIFDAFEGSFEVRQTLKAAAVVLAEPKDLTPEVFKMLKAGANQDDPGATEAWALVEAMSKGRRASLDGVARRLRADLKLKVKAIGADAAQRSRKIVPDDSNVIFLDFELRPDEVRGTLSSSFVKRIYQQFKDQAAAPLVILMSSQKISEAELNEFQKQTELLSGMFYFVEKADLYVVEKLHYRLAAFAKSLSTGQTMQRFVHRVEAGLNDAKQRVFRDIRSLSIADYAFLQSVKLHDDGQPMGEYLMWLFSAHLVRELGVDTLVREAEAAVDNLAFEHLPPTQAKPSTSLGALYSSAVMRPLDPLPNAPTNTASYLQFGDLFRKPNSKRVWICLTPACDLAFGETRPVPSSRSVLFLPGDLLPIEKPLTAFQQRQPRTELIQLGGATFRIVWNTKELAQTPYGKLKTWLDGKEARRIARLMAPFALEVQRSFASDLTRIGMPVPPPLYNPVSVRLTCLNDQDGDEILTTLATSGALLSGSERGAKLLLGSEFMDGLPEMLAKAELVASARLQKLEAQAEAGASPGPAAEASRALEKLSAARQDMNVMSGVRGPFALARDEFAVLADLIMIAPEGVARTSKPWIPLRLEIVAVSEIAEPEA